MIHQRSTPHSGKRKRPDGLRSCESPFAPRMTVVRLWQLFRVTSINRHIPQRTQIPILIWGVICDYISWGEHVRGNVRTRANAGFVREYAIARIVATLERIDRQQPSDLSGLERLNRYRQIRAKNRLPIRINVDKPTNRLRIFPSKRERQQLLWFGHQIDGK